MSYFLCRISHFLLSVFTSRGLGNILGAIFAGIVFPKIRTGKMKLMSIGASLTFNGIAMVVVPMVNKLWLLGTVSFVTTLTSSYLNTGLESFILVIWSRVGNRVLLFLFSICDEIDSFSTLTCQP